MRLKYLFAVIIFLPVCALADAQKNLCDAIQRGDELGIVNALSEGASLTKPCEKKTPFDLARDTGNEDLWAYLVALRDGQKGKPIPRPATPEQQVEELLKDFVVLEDRTPKFPDVLPDYLTNQDKYLDGRVKYGEPVYALDEKLILAPTTVNKKPYQQLLQKIAEAQAIVKKFGATGKVDFAVFKNPDSLKKVYDNVALLEKKHSLLNEYLVALETVRKSYTSYEKDDKKLSPFAIHFEKLFKQVTEDTETTLNYIHYLLTLLSEPTTQQIENLLGIRNLPEYYAEPIRSFMALSAHDSSVLRLFVDDIIAFAKISGKPEKQLNKIAESMGYILQRVATEIPDKGPKLFQFLPRLQSVVVLSNTQFDTDATPSLLFPASKSENHKLNRAYKAEYQLAGLIASSAQEIQSFQESIAYLSKEERDAIDQSIAQIKVMIGQEGLAELKEQLKNAVSVASSLGFPKTIWTCPMPGLGALLHSGWFRASVPSKTSPSILKATRTLGMTRGKTVAFGSVDIDFTAIGEISVEQAQALIYFIQDVAEEKAVPESRRRGMEKLLVSLEKLFSAKQREIISQTTKTFVDRLEKEIAILHDSIKKSINE